MSFIPYMFLPLTNAELETVMLVLDYFRLAEPIPKPHLDSGLVETVFQKCVALEMDKITKGKSK